MNLATLPEVVGPTGLFVDGDWVESKDQDPEGDVRLIQLADIGDGEYLDKSSRFMTSEKAAELRCTYLKPGDILVARMPDPIGRACIFPGDSKPCVTVVDVCIVRPDPNIVDTRWLLHLINSALFRSKINSWIVGATRQRISRGNLSRLEFSLPSVGEQKRIVAILDKADAIRRKRRQAIRLADEFPRSVFLDMFGDPITMEEAVAKSGWREAKLEELATLHRGYDLPVQDRLPGAIPIYAANGVVGYHSAAMVPGPGVVTGRSGTLGSVAYADQDYWPLNTALYVSDFHGNEPRFVEWFLRLFKLERFTRGAGVPTLNRNLFHGLQIIVPSLKLQQQFAAIYDAFEAKRKHLKEAEALSADLFNSLSQRAFRGDL